MTQHRNYFVPQWPAPANVRACITTREGGYSEGVYAANNMAAHVGDNPQLVARNRRVLCDSLPLEKAPQWLEQIHGVKVVRAQADALVRTADGSFSTEVGLACVVMTADCLPVLLCDRRGTQVAAVHAGWRGLAKGILERAIKRFNCPANQLLAYFGPAISQPHFEVGVEVLEAFFRVARNPAHSDAVAAAFQPAQRPLHFYADIYALARAELNALGVRQVYGGEDCTFRDAAQFYSYRRDKTTGRMASMIWLSHSS